MTFHFSIEYKTQWGEELRVIINGKEYELNTFDGAIWAADIKLKSAEIGDKLSYQYAVYRDGQLIWTEWAVYVLQEVHAGVLMPFRHRK